MLGCVCTDKVRVLTTVRRTHVLAEDGMIVCGRTRPNGHETRARVCDLPEPSWLTLNATSPLCSNCEKLLHRAKCAVARSY